MTSGFPSLSLYSILSACWEISRFFCCRERADPAQADVTPALPAGGHCNGHIYLHHAKCTVYILVQFERHYCGWLPHLDVLHSRGFCYALSRPCDNGLRSLCSIYNPLRYATILTNAQIAKLGLMGLIRAVLFILPLPLLLSRQPFCANCIIPHTYCDHMAVAKILCGDITVNRTYGLVLPFVFNGLDLMLIALSYSLIIRAVLRISSKKAHQKALNTSAANICGMLMSYPSFFFSTLTYRFGQGITPHIHIILANIDFLIPTMLHTIIYGVKNKELLEKVGKYTCRMYSPGGH
ncbi:unnamed protein product [Natator depressus]